STGRLPDLPPFPTRRSSDLWIATIAHHRRAGHAEQGEPISGAHHTREREIPVTARLLEDGVLAAEGWEPGFLDQLVGSERRFERSEEHTSELQSHLNLVCRL